MKKLLLSSFITLVISVATVAGAPEETKTISGIYTTKTAAAPENTIAVSSNYSRIAAAAHENTIAIPDNYSSIAAAPLEQIKTIPGDYATIAEAVAALNASMPAEGIIVKVAAGHAESITAPIILTATGTSAARIQFVKNGIGDNPKITRTDEGTISTSTIGNLGDGVVIIQGSDYITFDGIDLATAHQGIEYGYYLRKASATDGCSNVTIKNSAITMTRGTSQYVVGIHAGNNSSSASSVTVSAASGAHSNLTITGNTISNVFMGMLLKGHATHYDRDYVVGAAGAGNTIINYGGEFTTETSAIRIEHVSNIVVSSNTIDNTAGGGTQFTGATGYGIYNVSAAEYSFTASDNTINLTTQASMLYGIRSNVCGEVNISGNTVTLKSLAAGTSTIYYISNNPITGTAANITISGNRFGPSETFNTGTIYLINNQNSQLSPATINITNNITTGTITRTGTGGGFFLYSNTGGPTAPETISGNIFSNINQAGTSSFSGILSNTTAAGVHHVSGNTISNITSGSSNFTGIDIRGSLTRNIHSNNISNITTSGAITAITNGTGNGTVHINGNIITNLNSSSTSGTSPVIGGILIGYGTSVYVYNNMISDLHATASTAGEVIRAISVTSTSTAPNSAVGLYYNTIYLNSTSAGTSSGSSAVYHIASSNSTAAMLDLRNNILINTSTPGSSGRSAALRRSTGYHNNFSELSGNNILFAGTPGIRNLIYYDGLSYQTLEEYQAEVAPREQTSHSELPPFVNTTTKPFSLKIRTDIPTLAEGAAVAITTPIAITTDFEGDTREASPDIGADEFTGISGFVANPALFTATPASSVENRLTFSTNTDGNTVVLVFNATGTFTPPSGAPVVGGSLAGGTVIYSGVTSPYLHGSLTTGNTYHYKAFSYNGTSYSRGLTSSAVAGVLAATNFQALAVSQTVNSISWTKNSGGNEVIVAVHNSYPGGNPTNGTLYNVGDVITNGGTVIYRGPASGYSHTSLTPWTQYYYKIWSVDAYNYHSTGLVANCVTYAQPVTTLPYLQNFEGAWSHVPAAPEGWEVDAFRGTWAKSSDASVSGSWSARGQVTSTTADAYLISPAMVLPDDNLQLSWNDKVSVNTNITNYKVLLSTTGKEPSSFTAELGDFTCTNTAWELRTIDLTAYRGQTVHLAFWLYSSALQYSYFNIDDVLIETLVPGAATLVYPTNGMTAFAGEQLLQWQAPLSSSPITAYRVYLGTVANPTTLVYEGTAISFLATALAHGNTYYWKVVPVNANGSATDVPVWTFATVRQAQIAESFEDEWSPPAGWQIDAMTTWWQSEDSKYHGNKSIYRYTSSTPGKLQTPLVSVVSGDKLEFYVGTGTSTFQRIQIFYSSDRTAWTPIGGEMTVIAQKWTYFSTDLASLAGGQYYLAIASYYAVGGNGAYVYIDHVTGPDIVPVIPGPAREPTPANGSDWISGDDPLKWWAGSPGGVPTGYRVYIGTDGGGISRPTNIANGTVVSTATWVPPTPLTAGTLYYWQVVPFITEGEATGNPIWSFTTAPAGGVQIGLEDKDYLDQPLNPYYNYNYTQAIYLQPEINIGGLDLTRIYYQWSGGEGGDVCRDWVIFVGHTSKSTFTSKTDWVPVAQMTKVFDGIVTLPVAAGWVAIDFDVAFPYNNTDNMVIAVHEYTPGYQSNIYFLGTDTDTPRALVFYDDGVNPNPASPPTADFIHSGVANIRMHFGVDTRIGRVVSEQSEGLRLELWPNPVTDKVHIKVLGNTTDVEAIEVLDLAGRKVMAAQGAGVRTRLVEADGHSYELDVSQLPQGIYLVRLSGKGWSVNGRMVK